MGTLHIDMIFVFHCILVPFLVPGFYIERYFEDLSSLRSRSDMDEDVRVRF